VWQNENGDIIAINTNYDVGAAWVTLEENINGNTTRVSHRISPIFLIKRKPIGEYATEKREDMMLMTDWKYGTTSDAAEYALNYIKNHK
jgi:hypothetical protein